MARNLYLMSEMPSVARENVAHYVSDFTQGPEGLAGRLLQITVDDVLIRPGVILCDGDDGISFRGYGGARPPIDGENGMEMGPHIVPGEYQRQGFGLMVLSGIARVVLATGNMPYVLGNSANSGNLRRVGFEPIQPGELSQITYDYCQLQCPLYEPDRICCNDPVILRGEPQVNAPDITEWPLGASIQMPALQTSV